MGLWVGQAMSRGVMTMTDPLDKLLRDAAGATPDPGPSRHSIRAGLAPDLARRRRRERHARVRLTVAITAALLVVMCGQLGSEDFVTTSEPKMINGRRYQVYKQGLGGQKMWLREPGSSSDAQERRGGDWKAPDAAVESQKQLANEWLTAKAAHEGVIVGLTGYALGGDMWFSVQEEILVNGKYVLSDVGVEGQGKTAPEGIRAYMRAGDRQNPVRLLEISLGRRPDFSLPMTINGLEWDVNAWRITLPGMPEMIYYTGLRHDGVRSKDGDLF